MRLRVSEVQQSNNGACEKPLTGAEKKLRNLRPFGKGYDPRRNLKGRPRTFDEARALAQSIAHELSENKRRTVIESILRQWANSKEPQLQKAFVEYAFGKVPDKLDCETLENKTTLILHYGHEREKIERERLLRDGRESAPRAIR